MNRPERYMTKRQSPSRRSFLGLGGGLLAGAAGLGLSGCAGLDTAQPSAPGALTAVSGKKVTLDFAVSSTIVTELAWARAVAADFMRLHPNIHLNVYPDAQIVDIKSLVTNALSGTLPDIMRTSDVLSEVEAAKGIFLDLTPYLAAYGYRDSEFVTNIMDLGRYNGRQLVVPRGVDQVMVAYNPALFRKFGVPKPRMGWTWDEFKAASRRLTQKVGSTQYYAVGISNTYAAYPIYLPFMRGWGGEVVNRAGTRALLDDPRVIQGVAEMCDFFRKYSPAFQKPPADPFLAGTAAMDFYVRPTLIQQMVNPAHTKWLTSFVPEFVNFPLLPTPRIGAGMQGWAGTVNTRHPHETAAFLLYTLSRRGQQVYARASGEVPVRNDLHGDRTWQQPLDFGGKLDQTAFYAYSQYQSYPPSKLPIATNPQMASSIATGFDEIRLGRMSVPAAMRQVNEQINQTLKSLA